MKNKLGVVSMMRFLFAIVALSVVGFSQKPVQAHEIEPIIVTVEPNAQMAELRLRGSAEAFIAGVDLSVSGDTALSSVDHVYDELRLLNDEALAARAFETQAATFAGLSIGEQFALRAVDVEPQPNSELARDTVFTFTFAPTKGLVLTWPERLGDFVLRFADASGEVVDARYVEATVGQVEIDDMLPLTAMSAFVSYIPVGFDHIIPKGLDHILFVIGLFLLSFRWRDLLWQISAFTVAHTVTLAMTSLGILTLSGAVVEPLIAASIAYVAFENIWSRSLGRGRVALIFGFGLLHGMGFASVLGDFGLPEGQFIPSLIGFNIGVELGQLAVVALCWVLLALPFGQKEWYRSVVTIPASVIIGLIGIYWVIERTIL